MCECLFRDKAIQLFLLFENCRFTSECGTVDFFRGAKVLGIIYLMKRIALNMLNVKKVWGLQMVKKVFMSSPRKFPRKFHCNLDFHVSNILSLIKSSVNFLCFLNTTSNDQSNSHVKKDIKKCSYEFIVWCYGGNFFCIYFIFHFLQTAKKTFWNGNKWKIMENLFMWPTYNLVKIHYIFYCHNNNC